jgi:amiloride-sensitive sodium channel
MFTASYFIMELWDKWENSPVFVSIQSTSLPVPQVPFPAVTICSVNKIQEKRLVKTVAKIYQEQDR